MDAALTYLKEVTTGRPKPNVLIICGSGLSSLSETVDKETKLTVEYSNIPDFPQVTVVGHAGEMVFGSINGVECMILRGRFHSYEGHKPENCVLPVRLAFLLGCKIMLVTNACGGINRSFNVGDIALITDHIGFPILSGSKNPLVGPNDSFLGPRFPAMSNAYDIRLRELTIKCAQDLGISHLLQTKSTYAFVSGPAYETAAESAMLSYLGADTVGMSTVPEVIAAKHCGMRILGLSLVTNKVVLPGDVAPIHASHEEVLETTRMRTKDVQGLVQLIISSLKVEDTEHDIVSKSVQTLSIVTPSFNSIEKRLLDLDISTLTSIKCY